MPQFAITLDAEKVTRTLSNAMAAVKDWTPAFQASANEMMTVYGWNVFQSQGPPGEAWAALSPATKKARMNRWGYYRNEPIAQGQTLVWTGRLRAGFRNEVRPTVLRIYNDVDYFKHHQQGGTNLPKRRMLYLSQDRIYGILRNMNKQLKDRL